MVNFETVAQFYDFFLDGFPLRYFIPSLCLPTNTLYQSKEMSFMARLSCVASFNDGPTFALAHHRQFLKLRLQLSNN